MTKVIKKQQSVKKKSSNKFSFICPFCGKKQTTAIEWQNASIAFEFQLKSGKNEEVDQCYGEHESWTCSNCEKDLPFEIAQKIEKMLGWYV